MMKLDPEMQMSRASRRGRFMSYWNSLYLNTDQAKRNLLKGVSGLQARMRLKVLQTSGERGSL